MATSGSVRPSSNGVLVYWSLTSQSVATNQSVIHVAVGWSFQSSPTDRQLDGGLLQVQGQTIWSVPGRVKNYTGSTGVHDYYAWSGSVTINHDAAGNATLNISAHMTGYSGYYSSGSGSWSLPTIPRFPSAPGAPAASGYADTDPTTVSFTWSTPADVGAGLTQFQLQANTGSTFAGTDGVNVTAAWANSLNATGVPKGTTLYARVRAASSAGWGPWSAASAAFTTGTTVPGTPAAPTLSGIGGSTMTVSWSAPSDTGGAALTTYEVMRATNSSFTAGAVTTSIPAPTNSFQVTGLVHTTTYWFRVRVTNAAGKTSGWSSATSAATTADVPGAPAAPTITGRTPSTMTVSWSAPADTGGSAITGYELQWSSVPNFDPAATVTASSPYTIGGLTASASYYVRVRAINSLGAGPWSTPTPTRTTSGARVPNGSATAWIEADVWVAVQGAQGYEWRRCRVVTIAGS